MSSAICFKVDQSKILSSGNGLKNRSEKKSPFRWVVDCVLLRSHRHIFVSVEMINLVLVQFPLRSSN